MNDADYIKGLCRSCANDFHLCTHESPDVVEINDSVHHCKHYIKHDAYKHIPKECYKCKHRWLTERCDGCHIAGGNPYSPHWHPNFEYGERLVNLKGEKYV